MPQLLSRIGLFSSRHRVIVIAAWLVIFAFFTVVTASSADTNGGNSAGSTEATRALSVVNEKFPDLSSGTSSAKTLQLVMEAKGSGKATDATTAKEISSFLDKAAVLPHVKTVTNPFDANSPYISSDRTTVVSTLTFSGVTERNQQATYDKVLDLAKTSPADIRTEVGGQLFTPAVSQFGAGEIVGILIAFLVLFLTFGSLVVAGLNLLIALFGVGIGTVGVLAYSAINPIQGTTITLATMLGLAVGIDYTLFILTRFRSELREGRSVPDAIGRSVGTAGTAVVFAGLTVMIALAGLSITGISSIRDMGLAGAFGVLIAVLMALTVLPIILRALGHRALPRKERRQRSTARTSEAAFATTKNSFLHTWVTFVVKRPVVSLLGAVLILGIVAAPIVSMKTASNVPGGDDPKSTERYAYNLIVDKFGGVQSPLIVLVQGDDVSAKVTAVQEELRGLDDVEAVLPGATTTANDAALLTVIPNDGPIANSTKQLVADIRSKSDAVAGVNLQVTGETAIGVDSNAALHEALIKYLIVIVVLSFLLLIVMFRSLLVPLIATLGFLLSLGASFGASTAVFQWGWLSAIIAAPQGDPMLSILPIILVGVLFGLAMDYQVFLVSRIKEMHSKGMTPKDAIVRGFTKSGPVLVAAATIMTVVFAGFATSEMHATRHR
ncbi:MAG: transporter, partial [Frondihabitans sp.]|nr:transporter [Frondihabitans sp.]